MVSELKGTTLVTSTSKGASSKVAKSLAKVFSENWLEGAPQNEPLVVVIEDDFGEEAVYIVRIVRVH